MALSRKWLAALGIDADKIDEIINAHAETVNGLKEEMEGYKADASKYAETKTELDNLKKQTGGKDYDKLKKEFDDYKAEVTAKETKAAKEKAYKEVLRDSNLTEKGIEKALKYADWDKLELDDDGKLKDAKDHIKAAKEEWSEYISKTQTNGAHTATPPANTGGNAKTKEEIMAIKDTKERQTAIAQNHELFGF